MPQTTVPQDPNNKENDSIRHCPHCCEVSITGRLGGMLLPVSLTGRGVTRGGKSLKDKPSHQGVRKTSRTLNTADCVIKDTFFPSYNNLRYLMFAIKRDRKTAWFNMLVSTLAVCS